MGKELHWMVSLVRMAGLSGYSARDDITCFTFFKKPIFSAMWKLDCGSFWQALDLYLVNHFMSLRNYPQKWPLYGGFTQAGMIETLEISILQPLVFMIVEKDNNRCVFWSLVWEISKDIEEPFMIPTCASQKVRSVQKKMEIPAVWLQMTYFLTRGTWAVATDIIPQGS